MQQTEVHQQRNRVWGKRLGRCLLAMACVTAAVPALSADSYRMEYKINGLKPLDWSIAPATLPPATADVPYSHPLADLLSPANVSGLEWSALGLPSWLSINSETGEISGTPTYGDEGDLSFTAIATRHSTTESDAAIALSVTLPPINWSMSGASLPEATVGTAYAYDFSSLITPSGVQGIGWSTSSLPGWLSMNAGSGAVSGTPVANDAGSKSFTVIASRAGESDQKVFNIVVNGIALQVTQISLDVSHTCAVTTSGAAKCWGKNYYGQLGDGTTTLRTKPVTVVGLGSGVASIDVGSYHSCAVTTGGAVKCWGRGTSGQLGNNATSNSLVPVSVYGMSSGWAQVDVKESFSCARSSAGMMKCWGSNSKGQLGVNSTTDSKTPLTVIGMSSGVTDIAVGSFHACAIKSGGYLQCWGWNTRGEVGDNSFTQRNAPVNVYGTSNEFSQVTVGSSHTCARTKTGGVKCWGYNANGQLGVNNTSNYPRPVNVSGLSSGVTDIATNGFVSCAVQNGAGKCWGYNSFKNLGDGTTTHRYTPVDAHPSSGTILSIETGGFHTCFNIQGEGFKCWGRNDQGQLGDGTTTARSTPVDINSGN